LPASGPAFADLGCADAFGGLGQHRVAAADQRQPAELVERHEAANQSSVLCVGDTIVSANGLQMNQHVRSDQMFFHHADEVATAADSHRIGLAKLFDRVFEVTRI
jgi:hypothetical protein